MYKKYLLWIKKSYFKEFGGLGALGCATIDYYNIRFNFISQVKN